MPLENPCERVGSLHLHARLQPEGP
jgi:hypothetical protein